MNHVRGNVALSMGDKTQEDEKVTADEEVEEL